MGLTSCGKSSLNLHVLLITILLIIIKAKAEDIFLEWHLAYNSTISPITNQTVIAINGMFPGPLLNCTTNDVVYVNVFNHLDEPLLMTWNGIQQRLNSWQDGVSGTNCPIYPGKNWTYGFQPKDQIGTYTYFPSTHFHKAAGGFGSIRVNNRVVIPLPFARPEQEFDLLIGDWYEGDFKKVRSGKIHKPKWMLLNGKGPFNHSFSNTHESFNITKGKTYRFRISNVGTTWSINFRIQNHTMELVELEGSYVNKLIRLKSLDIHVGQSYSVLITANQPVSDYYIVATPKMVNLKNHQSSTLMGLGVLHYENSTRHPSGHLPNGPDPFDIEFSIEQAKSIRWNLTAGAARPNPQGTFNVQNVTLGQRFILDGSEAKINGTYRFTVNNVSYHATRTPLKLADRFLNGAGVYVLDEFPVKHVLKSAVNGTFVASANHKVWLEIILENSRNDVINSWHLDGFGFFVMGFGHGKWNHSLNSTYNHYDPVYRSTVQVYPGGWTSVWAYMDNPGMWNLRSQLLKNWYLGQELYVRVFDPDNNAAKEFPPPDNLQYCGLLQPPPLPPSPPPTPEPIPPPPPSPAPHSGSSGGGHIEWFLFIISMLITL